MAEETVKKEDNTKQTREGQATIAPYARTCTAQKLFVTKIELRETDEGFSHVPIMPITSTGEESADSSNEAEAITGKTDHPIWILYP